MGITPLRCRFPCRPHDRTMGCTYARHAADLLHSLRRSDVFQVFPCGQAGTTEVDAT